LSEEEARLRAELYLRQRWQYQSDYYRNRIREFIFNANRMLTFSAILMGASTVVSSSSILSDNTWLPFATAFLAALAGTLSAFRSLYQWERQAAIYESAWLAMQQARLAMPDESFMTAGDFSRFFPEMVRQTENVLRSEASQWGQIENTESKPEAAPPAN
jgi:hypothetical protein